MTSPTDECDLILKGGVTSGVVYPAALTTLMARYRIRGVGGSSAGAIAAAVAAAAEFGRQTGHEVALERAEELGRELAADERFFRRLFRPQPRGRRLLDAVFGARSQIASGPWYGPARTWGAIRFALSVPESALGIGLGALLAGLCWWAAGGVADIFGLLALTLLLGVFTTLGGILGLGLHGLRLWHWLGRPEASGMGLCTGYRTGEDTPDDLEHSLTGWLDRQIREISGKAVLTFADLQAQGVDLRMVTTNLNRRHPLVIPRSREHDDSDMTACLARVRDLRQWFPESTVAQMVERDANLDDRRYKGHAYDDRYVRVDFDDSLPVLVAVRMSLSFPALLTAVRFFGLATAGIQRLATQGGAIRDRDLQHRLFSDGGIASNFPLNLFDSWLPSRPTFGITLVDGEPCGEDLDGKPLDKCDPPVRLLRAGDAALSVVEPAEIEHFGAFLNAIFDTARNYRDNAQTAMASYRERIVSIFLGPNEGGLTLDMPPETIEKLIRRGAKASEALVERYADANGLGEHQWVRMRVLGAHLERLATGIMQEYGGRQGVLAHLDELLAAQLESQSSDAPWYASWDADQVAAARTRLEPLLEVIEVWSRALQGVDGTAQLEPVWDRDAPRPDGALRVATEL